MKEKLIIKNFGPIKSVDLDLGKITVLIGEQATGKSTIAKVLAMCRYFSYIINYTIETDKQDEFCNNEQFLDGLRKWEIDTYLTKNSEITYKNHLYKFEFRNKLVIESENVGEGIDYEKKYYQTTTSLAPISNENNFAELLKQLENLKIDELKEKDSASSFFQTIGWTPNENFYRLNVKKVMDNPLFIPTERVTQSLSSGKNLLVSEAIQDELNKLNKIVRGFNNEIRIEPLSLTYKNERGLGFIKKDKEDSYYSLHNGASGYQSTIPIVLAIKFYTEFEKRKRTFIVEEPEINLFPSAQRKLMSFFVENINVNGHSFLIPTHSPYFLSAINDLLVAYKKGQTNEIETNIIIKKEAWLNPDDLSAYELKKGKAYNIFSKESKLISDNIIDDVSDEMNDEFERLLEI